MINIAKYRVTVEFYGSHGSGVWPDRDLKFNNRITAMLFFQETIAEPRVKTVNLSRSTDNCIYTDIFKFEHTKYENDET